LCQHSRDGARKADMMGTEGRRGDKCYIDALVGKMLDLHKRLAEAKSPTDRNRLQRRITATDQAIDNLVYELYDLTDEEIAIVEGAADQ